MKNKDEYDGYMETTIYENSLKVFYKYNDVLTIFPCLHPGHTSERRFLRLMGEFSVIDEDGEPFTREQNFHVWDILIKEVIPKFEKMFLSYVLCEECLREIEEFKSKEIILKEGEGYGAS
jgi:hypothetical protein